MRNANTPCAGVTTPDWKNPRFVLRHLWLPLLCVLWILLLIAAGGVDIALADRIYAWEGQHWALRQAFSTEILVHKAGRNLSLLAWFTVLALCLYSLSRDAWRDRRRPLAYLLVSTVVATALVAWIKHWSNMDCPWDLVRYGGDRPFIGLFGLRPVGLQRGACFPAGHASGGYAWVALYYFFLAIRPGWRWLGLVTGLSAGLLFGISQQLRGAHFVSHDICTLGICWATASLVSMAFWHAQAVEPELANEARATRA